MTSALKKLLIVGGAVGGFVAATILTLASKAITATKEST